MEKQTFSIEITAPRQKVWDMLFGAEGSRVETDWKEGSKALFLDGNNMGMVAKIAENREPEFLSIRHLGLVKNGVEDFESEEVKKWTGGFENYTLRQNGEQTDLLIELEVPPEHTNYLDTTWPKALDKVRELSEKQTEFAL